MNNWATARFNKDGTIRLSRKVLDRPAGPVTPEELRLLDTNGASFYIDRMCDLKRAGKLGLLAIIRCATCDRRLSAYGDEPVCLCETSSDDGALEDRDLTELAHIQHG